MKQDGRAARIERMNPLLSALLVTLSMSTAAAVRRAVWSPLAAPPHADPFAGVPHDLALWRGGPRSLTVAPTGAGGPSFPLALDASSSAARATDSRPSGWPISTPWAAAWCSR